MELFGLSVKKLLAMAKCPLMVEMEEGHILLEVVVEVVAGSQLRQIMSTNLTSRLMLMEVSV